MAANDGPYDPHDHLLGGSKDEQHGDRRVASIVRPAVPDLRTRE
jgi:hypothetical protein